MERIISIAVVGLIFLCACFASDERPIKDTREKPFRSI